MLEHAVKAKKGEQDVNVCLQIHELEHGREYLGSVENLLALIKGDCFTEIIKKAFLETELYKFISGVLMPYSAIQLEQLQYLTQLEQDKLRQLIIELIIQGKLNYKLDGNNLVQCLVEDSSSVALLREAVEIVELLTTHLTV